MRSSSNILLLLPILLPLVSAVVLLACWRKRDLQQILQVVAGTLQLALSGWLLYEVYQQNYLVTQVGGWKAPYGVTLIADRLSGLILFTSSLASFATAIYSLKAIDKETLWFGYYPIYYLMMTSISGILLAGDLFNLYVWIEVMLMSSFILLSLGGGKLQLEGTLKYTSMNLLGSFFMLMAIALVYHITGTLNLAQLAVLLPKLPTSGMVYLIAVLFFTSLGIKTAVFPLYFWLPEAYPTPPVPVAAIFSGLLAKVGFYTLLRTLSLLFPFELDYLEPIILWVAVLTILAAILSSLISGHLLKIFSLQVVSKIGYLVLGLGIFTLASLAGSIYYLLHLMVIKTNLFLLTGILGRTGHSYRLSSLGGMLKKRPGLSIIFLINLISLGGIPPLAGFWGKLFLIKAALDAGFFYTSAIALVAGILTLIAVTRVWKDVFWQPATRPNTAPSLTTSERLCYYVPIYILTAFILAQSLLPGYFYNLAETAAYQILAPAQYVHAVLPNATMP